VLEQGHFTLIKHQGRLSVTIESEVPFPADFESYVTEALALTLAVNLAPAISQRLGGGIDRITASGFTVNHRIVLARPVHEFECLGRETGDTWRFFGAYLSFLIRQGHRGWHPYSQHISNAIDAAGTSFASAALALSVAAEGIAKGVVPNTGESSGAAKDAVSSVLSHLRSWGGTGEAESDEALRHRLEGMVRHLGECSAKDRFYHMVAASVLHERHIKSWNKMRHQLAHGRRPAASDSEDVLECMWILLNMVYRLLFYACGYEGWCTDTSQEGFPRRMFRGRAPRDSEIAVAAYYLWENDIGCSDADRWDQACTLLREEKC
jgi:hypothetical protein